MKHLRENNETYFSHLRFAGWIGISLVFRGIIFLFHGLFPMVELSKRFNLEVTIEKLTAWNEYAKKRTKL
jgi:hypothetical protein